jgi:uroporphyrinogen decarboxylase
MTPHERFQACMRFQAFDRPPLLEFGPWNTTVREWMRQTGKDQGYVLAWHRECDAQELVPVDFGLLPRFEEVVLAEDAETVARRNPMGLTVREFKRNPDTSMPEFVAAPVQSRADWERLKARLDPQAPGRYPDDFAARVQRWTESKPILRLYGIVASYYGGPSLFGFARMLLGEERVLYAMHDDPDLVQDMMETATQFSIAVLARALAEAPVTLVQFWEDMCFRGGPLISPEMVRRFMVPRYRRITEAVRRAGVDLIFLDSDGDVAQLVPLWLDSGINGVFPMEQAAGNDLHAYRRQYGRRLLMTGGIDKRALAQGRRAIDEGLDRQIGLAFEGGYVPTLDHAIPPDVTYDSFMYYWRRKKQLLGV